MINAQKELLKAGGSILALAGTMARLKSRLNEKASDKAKNGYEKAANIKKENNELIKNNIEQVTEKKAPQSFGELAITKEELPVESKVVEKKAPQHFGELAGVGETFKQADAPTEKEVVEAKKPAQRFGELAGVEETPTAEQKYISSEESAYSPIKAENTETKIPVDEDVQGLIKVKQKNALRAAAGQKSQKRYQNIKAKLTGVFADYSNIDDAWREISLDPNVTDEMIKKAGFTKTQILEEWKNYKDSPSDWIKKINIMGEEYGIAGNEADAEDFSNYDFGGMLSAYIRAKVGGKTLKQQQEEYDLSKAEKEPEEENYKVWQDDSTEEKKDEVKTNRDFSGFNFYWLDKPTKEESTEEKKDEVKTNRDFSGIKF